MKWIVSCRANKRLWIAIFLLPSVMSSQTVTVDTIVSDMTLSGEAIPHGLTADWAYAPRNGWGNNPDTGWKAMIPWGVVYETMQGNTSTNSRVQLRNIAAWYLSKTDTTWRLWTKTTGVDGAAYFEDFAGDANTTPDKRIESDGSVSVRAGNGYTFHFWSTEGRVAMDPLDILGVYAVCEGRLILDNNSLPDDRSTASYIVSMGADYWRNFTVQWASDWSNNGDIGIGRFKYVTSSWRVFTMNTCTEQQLRSYPPPGMSFVTPVGSHACKPTPPLISRIHANQIFTINGRLIASGSQFPKLLPAGVYHLSGRPNSDAQIKKWLPIK